MSVEDRVLSDFVWTPERGSEPELRSISWNNLLLSDDLWGSKYLTASEIRINPDTALQSTVLLACCRIISETVAGLPLNVHRRLKGGHEEIASEIPLAHVLGFAPNSWQTKFEFFEQLVMNITLWGNSYTEVKSGRYGSVSELNNLHPSRMRVERIENGRLRYSYNDPQTGRLLQYTQDQVMHVRWTPEPDGVKGMMPVEISRDAIALSRACEIYASKFWANMGRPGVVLQTDGAISAETAERLRDNWERLHKGVQNAYKTAVLTNGLKVETFGATNSDSQYLEVRRFQCEEIARCFRLPLHLIQGQSGGNLEIQGQEFINYTLMPWLTRIEQAISRSLIYDDATYYAKFDTRGLLRGDSNSRASFYSTMLNLGIFSINEVRRMEGLGPLGDAGEKHLVAMNLQPLEEAVKPKPDPSMMPGFGSGAPPKAPGVPPSLSDVKTGKAPMAAPKGEDSAKAAGRAEARELSPQDAELEEAHEEIAEEEGKWSKESAHYIEKNPFAARGIKCHNCTHYVDEGGCGVVSGLISGDAICKLWVIPQEKISQEPEKRAFCPTGEGGGVKNDCGSKEGGGEGEGSVSVEEAKARLPKYVAFKSIGNSKNSDNIRIPSDDEVSSALKKVDAQQDKVGASRDLPAETPVALRIDIPAWKQSKGKTYVVTVHEGKPDTKKLFGKVLGYDSLAKLKGSVSFSSNDEDRAEGVAAGEGKTPLAVVNGKFDPSRDVPEDIDSWTPVGYDPQKAVYFYDKRNGKEVTGGTDAVSIGNTVFTRSPKYGNRNAKTHYRSIEEMMSVDSWGLEFRAYCPTGEGGGIDNSCGSKDSSGGDGASNGGSTAKPAAVANANPVSNSDVLKLLEKIASNPDGFTLDPASAEQPETGIMVSEFANDSVRSVKIKASEITTDAGAAIFTAWLKNNSDLLLNDKARFVGGWKTGDDFYIDVATRFDPDKATQALEAGRKAGQLAVFNLGTFKETWVKYDKNDDRKPKEWDSGFARARKDATAKQVYDESAPAIQDEDWADELTKHGKSTVRNYNGEPEEAALNERSTADSEIRHSLEADSHRNVSSVSQLSGKVDRQETVLGLVRGQSGREAGPVRGSAGSDGGSEEEGGVDSRAYCPTGEGGGVDNSCSPKDAGGSTQPAKSSAESGKSRELKADVAQSVISSPPTTRSDDGKKIVSSPFPKEDTYKFAGREFVSTVAAGKYLSDQQAAARGPAINSAKPLSGIDRSYVADSHVQQLQEAASLGIKPVFYTPEERQRQVEEYARIEPRILGGRTKAGFEVSPENAEFIFRAVQALTSSNATPFANMQRTDAVMRKLFDDDGRITTGTAFGVTGASIKKGLSRLQAVVDILGKRTDGSIDSEMGLTKARELFVGRTMRVGDFDKFFRGEVGVGGKSSWKPGSYLVAQEVPVFSTFGPKFGSFFANNTGDPSHLTADIWATRTWGRVTGELVQEAKPEKAKGHAKELLKVVRDADASHLHGVDGDTLVSSLKKMASTGEIDDVVRGWSSDRLRHYASTDYTEKRGTGGKLNKLAKNVVENDLSLMGDPGGGRRRENMINVYNDIQKKTGLPVAYAQDVLWQHEQDAYAALGAKTATEVGKLSFYSDEIKRIADDPSYRLPKIKKERRDEIAEDSGYYDDYERGGRENLLYWDMISHLSDDDFARLVIGMDTTPAERRAYCPTGDGGGVDNSCPPAGSDGEGGVATKTASPSDTSRKNVDVSDKREEIDSRLNGLGMNLDKVLSLAGGDPDDGSFWIRRDYDKPQEGGIHVERSSDVAGVKDGLFSVSVIRNAGTQDAPEIIVDHKNMEVSREVKESAAGRHAAAREFFRIMTDSVAKSVESGVSKIVLNAAGGAKSRSSFRGYTIWPRMGFDAPLPFHLRQKLPETLSHCTTLLDLHATREGTKWWKDNGTDIDVQMDLKRADSPQMQVFSKFVKHFMRDKRDLPYGTGDGWLSPADVVKLDELWEEIWDDGLLDDYTGDDGDFSQVEEKRAYCPTGEGNGIDNSCSSGGGGSLDNSWKESDEEVEVWEKDDLKVKSPVEGVDKIRSLAIEKGQELADDIESLGVSLDDALSIGSSPSGEADVTVGPYPDINQYTVIQRPAIVVATSQDVAGIRNAAQSAVTIHKDSADGELRVIYNAFFVHPRVQEVAPVAAAKELIRSVLSSVDKCLDKGVKDIRLDAAGDAESLSFKGYRLWPKFGFDGVIPRRMLTRLREQDLSPRALAEKRAGRLTVQALYETKAGQAYWEKHGSEIPMSMTLGDASSPGWSRFLKFKSRLGSLSESRSLTPGDEIFTEEELKQLDEMWEEIRRESHEEKRFDPNQPRDDNGRFASTGGGGSTEPKPKPSSTSRWGGDEQQWGRSNETEVWVPERPLFAGAQNLASVRIYRPGDVKGLLADGLKMNIAEAVLAAGAIVEPVERTGITRPRLEVIPRGDRVEMHWTAMGVATGKGFKGEEAEFAQKPGTAVKAAEASRDLRMTESGPVLHMGGFFIHPDYQGKGIALDSVLRSTSAPVIRLTMEAERFDHPNPNTRLTGYKVWPKYGYDAPMSAVIRELRSGSVPPEFKSARTLTDIFAMPGGPEWWAENGGPITLTFDTRPRSRNREILLELSNRARRKAEGRSMSDNNYTSVGTDSDHDSSVDEFWSDVAAGKVTLSGSVPSQEEWEQWAKEDKERATDGNPREVRPH